MSNEPGRGKKLCPNCQNYIGVRTAKCSCGHEFVVKTTIKSETTSHSASPNTPSRPNSCSLRSVESPAGRCPVAPTNLVSDEAIQNWAKSVLDNGLEDGIMYSTRAVVYFIREFWGVNTPEYKKVKGLVYETLGGDDESNCT